MDRQEREEAWTIYEAVERYQQIAERPRQGLRKLRSDQQAE